MGRKLRILATLFFAIASDFAVAQSVPNLRDYDDETRQSMEIACISAKSEGPAIYGACLNQQIASLLGSSGVPSLRDYDDETRQSMEIACISAKSEGPATYGVCLNRQIASLHGSSGVPSLRDYDGETRQSIEIACISAKSERPATYGVCLNRQIASLHGSSGVPSLRDYDDETRQSMEIACISAKSEGPAAYGVCLNRQIASLHGSSGVPILSGRDNEAEQTRQSASSIGGAKADGAISGGTAETSVNAISRFTTENMMKVHQGMGANEILKMFGAPKNISQSVCGASVGKPWSCTTWEYGEVPYDWANFIFAGDRGSLILNNFDFHRK